MRKFKLLLGSLLMMGVGFASHAETLALYTFTGNTPNPESSAGFVSAAALTTTVGSVTFATTTGFPNPPFANSSLGWNQDNINSAKAFAITLTEENGATFTITNISFRHRATPAGPSAMGATLNGTTILPEKDVANGVTVLEELPLTGFQNLTAAVLLIKGWTNGSRSTAGTGDFRIDDVLIQGTVTPPVGIFPPSVAAATWSQRTATSVVFASNITGTGGEDASTRGFIYDTTSGFDPESDGTQLSENGTFGTGPFSLQATGLAPETTYYFVSFAENSAGASYSPEASFTTRASPPSDALVYYTFTDNEIAPEVVAADMTAENFAVSANTLAPGTAQATTWTALGATMPYIQSGAGWSNAVRANAKHFLIELEADVGKAITITNISYIHRRTSAGPENVGAQINGSIVYTQLAFPFDTTELVSLPIVGYENLTGTVEIRIDGWGTAVSGTGDYRIDNILVQGFVDDEVLGTTEPTVTTPTSSAIVGTTATLGGTITDTGDTTVVERGIYWSTTMGFDPEADGTKVSESGSFLSGPFTVNVTGLDPDTTIYFVAFARNAAGSGFSAEDSFTSGAAAPSIDTPQVFSLQTGSADLGADITSDNGATVTRRGVVWDTTAGFDVGTANEVDESGSFATGTFSLTVSGLPFQQRVYYRAFAENSEGTTYTPEASFYAPASEALVFFSFSDSGPNADLVADNIGADPLSISAGSITYASANATTWTGSGVPYARSTGGWTETDQSTAKQFVFAFDTDAGFVATPTNISFLYRSTGAGPTALGITINGSSILSQDTTSNLTTAVSIPITGYTSLSSVSIAIQGWSNGSRPSTGGGEFQIDDILVQGIITPDGGPVDPDEPDLLGFVPVAGGIRATITTEAGFTYALEYTTNIKANPVVWV